MLLDRNRASDSGGRDSGEDGDRQRRRPAKTETGEDGSEKRWWWRWRRAIVDWRDDDGSGGDERRRYRHCNFVSSSSCTNTLQSQFEKNPNLVSNTGSHFLYCITNVWQANQQRREERRMGYTEKTKTANFRFCLMSLNSNGLVSKTKYREVWPM
ncbi:hypothetical protein F2Q69_00021361 [Brassica cretica]|uniref:Uncharacterized protein n=1 Tax=Brassica cretica TaxID=69181 RepID=A0A8S9QSB5_BRACR|nr:hypothetical protein F2Q69_00021361 [Brassica cretica]